MFYCVSLLTFSCFVLSGKSTLLEYIRSCHPEWNIIPEPLEQWLNHKNEEGKNILQLFYEDPKTWASPFQRFACLTRAKLVKETLENPNGKSNIFISERCLHTDRHVFATLLHGEGHITDSQWAEYIELYKQLTSEIPVDGIIYVNTRADLCYQRIAKRGRKEESNIEYSYLQALEERHDEWMRVAQQQQKPFIQIQSEKSELWEERAFLTRLLA